MTSLLLLSLFVILRLSPGEPFMGRHGKPHPQKHDAVVSSEEPCHFPFRYKRKMHYSCLPDNLSHQTWCATTENFDRDQKLRYCRKEERPRGHCDVNPCQNGGICEARRGGSHCICAAGFHGRYCEKENCFGRQRMLHVVLDTWLQFQLQLEECHCAGKKIVCKPVHGKACATNFCLNGGQCIELKQSGFCSCPEGFSGPLCDIDHTHTCYSGSGHLYRGMAQTTISGTPCLPWDSPVLLNEFSVNSPGSAAKGLGKHAFCRNPDNDHQPWCYVLREKQISWEFCNVTHCSPTTAVPKATGTVEAPVEGSLEDKKGIQNGSSSTRTSTDLAPVCGQRFTKTVSQRSRVVGGMVALSGAHPYMAAMYIGKQFCGGSLIASCWILTAAHCLEHRPDASQIAVVLGQTLFNISTEGSRTLRVQGYQLHENYSDITKQNDIALVQLKEDVPGHCAEFSHSISPVCLPSSREISDASVQQCQIAGWGHLYEGADQLSVYLQEADTPIIPQEQCRSHDVHGTRITPDMLCAGYLDGRSDACQGDSGGPLVCEEQGKATLRGIISWGTGCAEENKPGVYTNVAHHLKWIQSKMPSTNLRAQSH